MVIRMAEEKDLEAVTQLSFRRNQEEKYRVAYCCRGLEHIRNDYKFMMERPEHLVLVAEAEGRIEGVLGLFCMNEIHRQDCCGPFVEDDFLFTGTALIEEAKRLRPGYKFNFYFHKHNQNYLHMAQILGAKMNGLEHTMKIKREDVLPISPNPLVRPIKEEEYEQLRILHEQIFPGLYLSGSELVEGIGEEYQVFVIHDESGLCAYGVLKIPEDNKHGIAEVFAVEEHHRGNGYGRMVVKEVLRQGFFQYGYDDLTLIADDDNIVARTLYESVGFTTVDNNYNMSLEMENFMD